MGYSETFLLSVSILDQTFFYYVCNNSNNLLNIKEKEKSVPGQQLPQQSLPLFLFIRRKDSRGCQFITHRKVPITKKSVIISQFTLKGISLHSKLKSFQFWSAASFHQFHPLESLRFCTEVCDLVSWGRDASAFPPPSKSVSFSPERDSGCLFNKYIFR